MEYYVLKKPLPGSVTTRAATIDELAKELIRVGLSSYTIGSYVVLGVVDEVELARHICIWEDRRQDGRWTPEPAIEDDKTVGLALYQGDGRND